METAAQALAAVQAPSQHLSRATNDALLLEHHRLGLPPIANDWYCILQDRTMEHRLLALRAFVNRTEDLIERFRAAITNMETTGATGDPVHLPSAEFPAAHYQSVNYVGPLPASDKSTCAMNPRCGSRPSRQQRRPSHATRRSLLVKIYKTLL
jgi:hypothetical protein